MSDIYLIRHGATEANEKHQYCGSMDLPLSKKGIDALMKYKPYYQHIHSKQYISSGKKRTNQTLEILFDQPYIIEPAFCEMDFGDFEGRSYKELKEDPAYQKWIAGNNEINVCPNGESGQQMKERVLQAWCSLQNEDLVLVTHGGVIAAIMEYVFSDEPKNRYQWQPEPGLGYHLNMESHRYEKIGAKNDF